MSEDGFKAEKMFLRYAEQRSLVEGTPEYDSALSAFLCAYKMNLDEKEARVARLDRVANQLEQNG